MGGGPSSAEQKAEALNQAGKASIQVMDEYDFKKLFVVDRQTAIRMLKSGPPGIEHWNKTLSHVDIKLDSADFRGCDLSGADLRRGDLTGCDFRGAYLEDTVINFVRGARFDKATGAVQIEKAEDCSMKRADFSVGSRRTEYRVLFKNCDLEGARLKNRDVLMLTECTAKRVNFTDVGFRHADVSGTDFSGACFSNLRAALLGASGAIFNSADLQQSVLERSTLKDASFRKANLSHAGLAGCNFSGADLSGAKLVEADLSSCILQNVNLSKANLRGALLCNADLSGAVLNGADLTRANIVGAKLTPEQTNSAKGIKPEDARAGSVGPNIRELANVAGQSNRVSVSIRVDLEDEKVRAVERRYLGPGVGHESPDGMRRWLRRRARKSENAPRLPAGTGESLEPGNASD